MKLLHEKQMDSPVGNCSFKVFNDKVDFPFLEVQQIHEAMVLNASDLINSPLKEADGIYTLYRDQISLSLVIKTADCLPVAYVGKNGAAIVHAGWRGLEKGILTNAKIMELEPLEIYIGPAIQQKSYEVGPEFLEHFNNFPQKFQKKGPKYLFDLPGTAVEVLEMAFPESIVNASPLDTYCTSGHNSYRRNKTNQRNYNVLYIDFSKP